MKTEEIKRLVDGKFTVCRAELCATVWHLTAFCILFTKFIEKKKMLGRIRPFCHSRQWAKMVVEERKTLISECAAHDAHTALQAVKVS